MPWCAEQLAASIPDAASQHDIIVAYEPVWAIGTGRTPTNDDIANMHASIRPTLSTRFGDKGAAIRILYGGSLKPAECARNSGDRKCQWRACWRRQPLGK